MSLAPPDAGSPFPPGGTVRPVVRWGDPVMHRHQEPVTDFDAGLRDLVGDLVATMYAADGVGLAACQVGVDRAVFVLDCPDDTGTHHRAVVCNPTLFLRTDRARELDDDEEGCLSLPGAFVSCARPSFARVTGQGWDGAPVRVEGAGLLARCLQHETDHCDGIVFGDRLGRRVRKRLFRQAEERATDFGPDWPVGASRPSSATG